MELPKKQLKVKDYLISMINSGMRQGDLLPSFSEIAERLHVSKMTVVRVVYILEAMDILYRVQGKGTFVGSKSEAYKKVIPYYHYVPNEQNRKPVITFLSPFLYDDPFMAEITKGVEDGIDHNKYDLVKRHIWIQKCREDQVIRDAARKSTGIILIPSYPLEMQKVIRELVRKNYPLVLLDQWPTGLSCNSVSADNEDAVLLGMEHLYSLGHRKIVFISEMDNNSSINDRINAYSYFMRSKGLLEQVIIGKAALYKLFTETRKTERPSALFAYCDYYAREIATMLQQLGLHIPEDVSLMGFDNNSVPQENQLLLTTLQQPKYKIGRKAARLLEQIMDEKLENNICCRYLIPCELIIRESTGICNA